MKQIKYLLGIVLIILMTFGSVQAEQTNEQVILYWDFEEGSGDLVFDKSGNNNNGLMFGGTNFVTTNAFGTYSANMQGSNDYIDSLSSAEQPLNFSVSMWINFDTFTDGDYLIELDGNNAHFEIEYIELTDSLIFGYTNDLGVENEYVLESGTGFVQDTWYHIAVSIDSDNDELSFWRDNTLLLDSVVLADGYNWTSIPKRLRLGANHQLLDDYDGRVDELRLTNFILNDSQVSELFTTNTLSLNFVVDEDNGDGDNNITQSIPLEIINSTSPLNNSVFFANTVNFDLVNNEIATCDFYLNNSLYASFNDILSVNFNENFEEGNYKYFFYCENEVNNTLQFDISETTYFSVAPPNTTITFEIEGKDFNPSDLELYIVSPCVEEGYSAIGINAGYSPKYNPEGVSWHKIQNNIVTFNTTSEQHEFCLFNGRVIVNELGKTTNYDVVTKEGIIELGTIDVPNKNTNYFKVVVERWDIFDLSNPEAYAETTGSLAKGILLFILGLIILGVGVYTQSKVAVLIGGALLLAAFGISLSGVLALVQL